MKTIVVSGINLYTGGTLKVMQDCLSTLSTHVGKQGRIVALVHNEKQYPQYENVEYIAFPASRKSWLFRLYYEYFGFRKLSLKLNPYCWISMHDTTPNVIAEKRMVYCHNPFPFYRVGVKDFFLQPSIFLFGLFSWYIYKVNIRKNDSVIVQQEWIREAFKRMFSINNIIVATPVQTGLSAETPAIEPQNKNKTVFFYPASPMIHKNIETACEAAAILERNEGIGLFELVITLNGTENKYARYLHRKYKNCKSIRFAGFLKREAMDDYYQNSDCIVFPSKVETWGLPLTEAKSHGKILLVSDLPFGKESVGKYDKVKFIDPSDPKGIATVMRDVIQGSVSFDPTEVIHYEEPFASSWKELFNKTLL